MNREEIKEYLKRVDELELKLTGKDKDTYQWVLFGYNECARLLNEKEQENNQLKENNQAMQEEMCRTWEKLNIIKELRSWLEKDLLKYKTGFFTQDMGTTFKVSEHIKTIENVLSKLNELEGKNEK